jgi:hypothetical protein
MYLDGLFGSQKEAIWETHDSDAKYLEFLGDFKAHEFC